MHQSRHSPDGMDMIIIRENLFVIKLQWMLGLGNAILISLDKIMLKSSVVAWFRPRKNMLLMFMTSNHGPKVWDSLPKYKKEPKCIAWNAMGWWETVKVVKSIFSVIQWPNKFTTAVVLYSINSKCNDHYNSRQLLLLNRISLHSADLNTPRSTLNIYHFRNFNGKIIIFFFLNKLR